MGITSQSNYLWIVCYFIVVQSFCVKNRIFSALLVQTLFAQFVMRDYQSFTISLRLLWEQGVVGSNPVAPT